MNESNLEQLKSDLMWLEWIWLFVPTKELREKLLKLQAEIRERREEHKA